MFLFNLMYSDLGKKFVFIIPLLSQFLGMQLLLKKLTNLSSVSAQGFFQDKKVPKKFHQPTDIFLSIIAMPLYILHQLIVAIDKNKGID